MAVRDRVVSYPRADHVGSLIRPPALMERWHAFQNAQSTAEELREVQDAAIRDVVRVQEELGLALVTDGEFRRVAWSRGFIGAVDGMEFRPGLLRFRDAQGRGFAAPAPYAGRKLVRTRPIVADDYDFLAANVQRGRPKVTIPSPSHMHFGHFAGAADRRVYPALDEYWADLTAIYRAEIADLAARGCTNVQIDECPLAMLYDEENVAVMRTHGEDPDALVDVYVDALNAALRDRPPQMTVTLHMCRGNASGFWLAAAGYDRVAERVFNDVAVDAYLLEYDSERAGDFGPLRYVPAGKRALLGIVSTKDARLEPLDALQRRIEDASRYADIDRLGVCNQCGFATAPLSQFGLGENPMTPSLQAEKIARLVETARSVWSWEASR